MSLVQQPILKKQKAECEAGAATVAKTVSAIAAIGEEEREIVHKEGIIEGGKVKRLKFNEGDDDVTGSDLGDTDSVRSGVSEEEEEEEEESDGDSDDSEGEEDGMKDECQMKGHGPCSERLQLVEGEWENQTYNYLVCSEHFHCSFCQDPSKIPSLYSCFCADHPTDTSPFHEFFLVCEECDVGPLCSICIMAPCVVKECCSPVEMADCYHMSCRAHCPDGVSCQKCEEKEVQDIIKLLKRISKGETKVYNKKNAAEKIRIVPENDQEVAQKLTDLSRANLKLFIKALNEFAKDPKTRYIPVVIVRFVEPGTRKPQYLAIQPESKHLYAEYTMFSTVVNWRLLFEKFYPEVPKDPKLIEKFSPKVFPKEFTASIKAAIPGGMEAIRKVPGFLSSDGDPARLKNVPKDLWNGFITCSYFIEVSFEEKPANLSVADRTLDITKRMQVPNFGEFHSNWNFEQVQANPDDELKRGITRMFLNSNQRYPFMQYCILKDDNAALEVYSRFKVNIPLEAIEFRCMHESKPLRGLFDSLILQYRIGGQNLKLRSLEKVHESADPEAAQKAEDKEADRFAKKFGEDVVNPKLPADLVELYKKELASSASARHVPDFVKMFDEIQEGRKKRAFKDIMCHEGVLDPHPEYTDEEEDPWWCSDSDPFEDENEVSIPVLKRRIDRREDYLLRKHHVDTVTKRMKMTKKSYKQVVKEMRVVKDDE